MKPLIPLFIFSLLSFFTSSQDLIFRGSRSIAIGNASVSLIDEWSFFSNPGATAFLDKPSFGLNYSNQYTLSEFQNQDATILFPLKKGVFSSGISYSGFNAFSNLKAGLGYAILLNESFSVGVQFNYHQKRFLQLSNLKENLLTTEVGFLYKVMPNWNLGVNVNDFLGFFINDKQRSTSVRLGSDIIFSDKVHLLVEGYQSVFYSFQLRTGLEYEPIDYLFFRVGYKSNPTEMTFGFGYRLPNIKLDIASAFHPSLGWSPSISFNYVFGEKK